MNKILCLFFLLGTKILFSQYAPSVGIPGTSDIYKDSSSYKQWATSCKVHLGWLDVAQKNLGKPNVGDSTSPVGKADDNVLSLGDGGQAILLFDYPISNGLGPDFAVFENAFNNTFLELAFVEVSSDGIHFVRFPAISLSDTTTQFGNDAIIDATKLNNLAGKYKANYGTPFDLEELKDSVGLNIMAITHVKIVDVVGSINPLYGTRDSKKCLVNDPYPTPYPSCGFDLDAVGVINSAFASLVENQMNFYVGPNPVEQNLCIEVPQSVDVEILNSIGESVLRKNIIGKENIDVSNFNKGVYFLKINSQVRKLLIQ